MSNALNLDFPLEISDRTARSGTPIKLAISGAARPRKRCMVKIMRSSSGKSPSTSAKVLPGFEALIGTQATSDWLEISESVKVRFARLDRWANRSI